MIAAPLGGFRRPGGPGWRRSDVASQSNTGNLWDVCVSNSLNIRTSCGDNA